MSRFTRDDYVGKTLDDIVSNPDEPVFVIRGQDSVSGPAVRAWADLAERAGADPDILAKAREHARLMDCWRPNRLPDLPG